MISEHTLHTEEVIYADHPKDGDSRPIGPGRLNIDFVWYIFDLPDAHTYTIIHIH